MTTQASTFFCNGDSKGMVIQFIGDSYRTELSSSPWHFALGFIKDRPAGQDEEATFLKSACSSRVLLSDDGFNNLSVIGKENGSA